MRAESAPAPTANDTFEVFGIEPDGAGGWTDYQLGRAGISNYFQGWQFQLFSGDTTARTVDSFDYATRVITVSPPYSTPLPSNTQFNLFRRYAIRNETFDTAADDLMAQGQDFNGSKYWGITANAMSIALSANWDESQAAQAIEYFAHYTSRIQAYAWGDMAFESANSNSDAPVPGYETDDNFQSAPVWNGGVLWTRLGGAVGYQDSISFGPVVVDGSGGAHATQEVILTNFGDQPLTIFDAPPLTSWKSYSISTPLAGTTIAPLESLHVSISFDPLASGESTAQWTIYSDALNGLVTVTLSGFGLSPSGDVHVECDDSQFGEQRLSEFPRWHHELITVTNQGASPLSVYDVVVGEGSEEFAVGGLPASLSFAQPLVLGPTESFSFAVRFDAQQPGLRRGKIHIFTDDPDQPLDDRDRCGDRPGGRPVGSRSRSRLRNRAILLGRVCSRETLHQRRTRSIPTRVPEGTIVRSRRV